MGKKKKPPQRIRPARKPKSSQAEIDSGFAADAGIVAAAMVAKVEAMRLQPLPERFKSMLDELCVLHHGLDVTTWSNLQQIQARIAANERNPFGQSTRAFEALVEDKKLDLAMMRFVMDGMVAASNVGKVGKDQPNDDQLNRHEIAGLITGLVAESDSTLSERDGYEDRLVMGAAVASNGVARPMATSDTSQLQAQLANLRQQAVG